MQNYIPVLTSKGRPLAPCHPQRARNLVRKGKAFSRHKHGIRIIVLIRSNIPKVKNCSKVQLRIDPGPSKTGMAVSRDLPDQSRTVVMALELQHHGKNIKGKMNNRSQRRRNRRCRKTRYRQPRFNNRTKPDGWLPPSLLSRLQNTLTWVRRLSRLLPVDAIHVETTSFDPQVLRDPDIHGVQYQQGPLYRTNLRAAVLQRDSNKCVYCGKSGKRHRLELDHLVPRSANGSNRYDNRVAACHDCNRKKANQPVEQWLKRRPKKLAEVMAKTRQDLAPATHMNAILPRLLAELRQAGSRVVEHSAATTAAGRVMCGIEKSHHGDAAVTGCPATLNYMPAAPVTISTKGRGEHQRIMPNEFGNPRGDEFRKYAKLPRHVQRVTPTVVKMVDFSYKPSSATLKTRSTSHCSRRLHPGLTREHRTKPPRVSSHPRQWVPPADAALAPVSVVATGVHFTLFLTGSVKAT